MINKISSVSFCSSKILRQLPKKAKQIEEELPDFFRDKELFDSKKDIITEDYFEYNPADIPANRLYYTDDRPYEQVVDNYRYNVENGYQYRDLPAADKDE